MRTYGSRWFRFLLQGIFSAGIILILAVSLPQRLLHLGDPFQSQDKEVSIKGLLEKEDLRPEDYKLLLEQTGLGRCTIDELRCKPDSGEEELLGFQKAFLGSGSVYCEATSFFTRQDQVQRNGLEKSPIAPLQDGDILVSFASHTLGWKHGHAGIVVEAEKGCCLEAVVVGSDSKIKSVEHWRKYSNFAILRLKEASKQRRKAIADYAEENLCGIPYSLASGIFGEKAPRDCRTLTAQCAYLIWYAYDRFGYDLDSDGGKLVTVKDLADSPYLEIVQLVGLDPKYFER